MASPSLGKLRAAVKDDPLWYKDAVIYEARVRAFYDKDGDGIGDFQGLTEKLDYLRDLGVTAIWLLPFYPSPLRDDGYDIADFTGIHPDCGSLADFKVFLREAHRRDLRVITELVLNHTSNEHPWFQRARRAPPGSPAREFYVWNQTPDKYKEARIIFKDFEQSNWTWDAPAGAYYWHRFFHHQPDLNYDNPAVHEAVFKVLDFWLELDVDGLRLDAVPYLYERESTDCENLKETHEFLRLLRGHIDRRFKNRMLLAEANQWPEDSAAYFGAGDECHMAFHFPIMPRLFMAIHMEDRYPIVDILKQTPEIPSACQWALFLRNHDELTLEMVTDEERDYMYRVYAQDPRARINLGIRRRLAPLLGNNRRKIELVNGLLFSLPGTPVIYYGDEIGMGDNFYLGDRNGVRTPMQWSSDRNAGFSRANPQRLYLPVIIDPEYHYETVNVETQQNNPHSLLWWTKRLIALRRRFKAFSRGAIKFLYPKNSKVVAFIRSYENENLLIVANLSRFVQYIELDLAEVKGMVPVELFGQTEFPVIGERPYMLTLGPHAFYWFSLTAPVSEKLSLSNGSRSLPALEMQGAWDKLFTSQAALLEEILPGYISICPWFRPKEKKVKSVKVVDAILVPYSAGPAYIALIEVNYPTVSSETYVLPLSLAQGAQVEALKKEAMAAIVTGLRCQTQAKTVDGVLFDASYDSAFCLALIGAMKARRHLRARFGELTFSLRSSLRTATAAAADLAPRLLGNSHSNTLVAYGRHLLLKLYRRSDTGVHPELEILNFLAENRNFNNTPNLYGFAEYRKGKMMGHCMAILEGFVPNEDNAWQHALDALGLYYEQALACPPNQEQDKRLLETSGLTVLDFLDKPAPAIFSERVGSYLGAAGLLGERLAGLHKALSAGAGEGFAPEPFSPFYRRSLYQSLRHSALQIFDLLGRRLQDLPEAQRLPAQKLLAGQEGVLKIFKEVTSRPLSCQRIRYHGDCHLGQALYTGKDFVFFDFEGNPDQSVGERRLKRCALRDGVGMVLSFEDAAYAALAKIKEQGMFPPERLTQLKPWARLWHQGAALAFLSAYAREAAGSVFFPREADEFKFLLRRLMLEKTLEKIGDDLNRASPYLLISLESALELIDLKTA